MKKILVLLVMMLGLVVLFSGCARWPGEPGPEPGETEYQLKITVEVAGVINSSDGIYYIVIDADGKPETGPWEDMEGWEEDFYYIKLKNSFFYFAQVKDDSESLFEEGNIIGNILQVTIALSDLEDPDSVDINVITTDPESSTTYDYLDGYFTIDTTILGAIENGNESEGASEEGGPDFDIVKVTAKITTL